MNFIKKNPQIAVDIETVEDSFFSAVYLESPDLELPNFRSLLLQAAYLMFTSNYDEERRWYKVGCPNKETRHSLEIALNIQLCF